jgi:hypothetical protein
MSGESDPFDEVRREPDLLARGRRATELLTLYQQRSAELARVRREAIDAAHRDLGMSFTQIAEAMGVTKGRITQIRGSAPARERAFFGVGPVSIGIPLRYGVTDRQRPLIAAEDVKTGEEIARLLGGYGLAVSRVHAIGSLGAAAHLAAHLPGLYAQTADAPMSLAVRTQQGRAALVKTEE